MLKKIYIYVGNDFSSLKCFGVDMKSSGTFRGVARGRRRVVQGWQPPGSDAKPSMIVNAEGWGIPKVFIVTLIHMQKALAKPGQNRCLLETKAQTYGLFGNWGGIPTKKNQAIFPQGGQGGTLSFFLCSFSTREGFAFGTQGGCAKPPINLLLNFLFSIPKINRQCTVLVYLMRRCRESETLHEFGLGSFVGVKINCKSRKGRFVSSLG